MVSLLVIIIDAPRTKVISLTMQVYRAHQSIHLRSFMEVITECCWRYAGTDKKIPFDRFDSHDSLATSELDIRIFSHQIALLENFQICFSEPLIRRRKTRKTYFFDSRAIRIRKL